MPYRIDVTPVNADVVDCLIDLGALDVDVDEDGRVAALMPDDVRPAEVALAAGTNALVVSPAVGRDAGSVWTLRRRPVRIGRVTLVPDADGAEPGAVRLRDTSAFGTGLHPTTALCLAVLGDLAGEAVPDAVLDVGTGSGVLALAALTLGVPHVTGIDIDAAAIDAARENARLNAVVDRLELRQAGPDEISGAWPLVMANVLAAPLIALAPALVRRVAHRGRLVLSGIPAGLRPDVERAYRDLGMHTLESRERDGWAAVVLGASW